MLYICDPVGSGLVASLAHPGGNLTGLTTQTPDISAKQLQLLKEALPQATRVSVRRNPGTACHPKLIDELKAAALALSIELNFVGVQKPEQLGPAFSAIRRAHAQALYVLDSAVFAANGATVLALAS